MYGIGASDRRSSQTYLAIGFLVLVLFRIRTPSSRRARQSVDTASDSIT